MTREEYTAMVDDLLGCQTMVHLERCGGRCECDNDAANYKRWFAEIEARMFPDTPKGGKP